MIKRILVLLLLLLSVSYVYADEVKQEPTISTSATVNEEYAPDTARIKFYVTNSGLNVNDIKEKNDKIVNDATLKIKAKLAQNEQIKTISYSVRNIYSYKDKIRIFQKYEVKNGFEVKLKDLSKISEIIKIATDSGIKEIGQLNFAIEESEAICNNLLAQSAKMAKKRAEVITSSVGEQILKAKEIHPSCSLDSSRVVSRAYGADFAMNKLNASAQENTNVVDIIEPGAINVRASVNIIYYLK